MNTKLFRAELAKNGYTQSRLAEELKMAPSTLVRKMKSNSFSMSEAEEIITILRIQNPAEIFLTM